MEGSSPCSTYADDMLIIMSSWFVSRYTYTMKLTFSTIQLCCLWISLTSISSVHSQVITIQQHDSGQLFCPEMPLTLTCVTSGSLNVGWESDNYIDPNGQRLEFNKFEMGTPKSRLFRPSTVATLTNVTDDGGTDVLETQLNITTLPYSAAISCIHASGSRDTVTVSIQVDPDMPQNMVFVKRNHLVEQCAVHLSWNAPTTVNKADISHYMIFINGIGCMLNETDQNLTMAAYPLGGCDAQHNVSVRAVNQCGRGESTPTEILNQTPKPLLTGPCSSSTGTGNMLGATTESITCQTCPTEPTCNGICIGLIVLLAASVIANVILVIIICCIGKSLACTGKKDEAESSATTSKFHTHEREQDIDTKL